MKSQLFLLFTFSTILCSPFLRKTDEVTEESCQKEGKKYQETITYDCKTGDSVFTVTKKEDCKSGKWTESSVCSIPEVTVDKCNGNPTFTAATAAVSPSCVLDGTTITTLTTQNECQTPLVWTDGTCTISGVKKDIDSRNNCEKTGSWTSTGEERGNCTLGSSPTDKATCEGRKGEWTPSSDGNETEGSCSDGKTNTSKTDCEQVAGVFTSTSETVGSCTVSAKTTKSDCETAGNWEDEYCSVDLFKSKETCDGKTPTYNPGSPATAATCEKDGISIPGRTTAETCEVTLEVKTVGSCSNEKVTKKEDCEAKATADEVKVAECVDDKSSNSDFLKAINFALFAICLLF